MDSIEYEALMRAREMQRGQSPNKSTNPTQGKNQSQSTPREPTHSNKQAQESADSKVTQPLTPAQPLSTQNSDLLSTLFEDKEKLLILVLILILTSEESSDPSLILALLYLII
ncbi:MAG: hypothetical protein IJ298_06080 [Ruminococcus sp.]|nr:hypothetical protein [Ruminococcus sp.]